MKAFDFEKGITAEIIENQCEIHVNREMAHRNQLVDETCELGAGALPRGCQVEMIVCHLEKLRCLRLGFASPSRCASMRREAGVFALCIELLTIGFSKLQMGILRE
jgi:hypothetical protein